MRWGMQGQFSNTVDVCRISKYLQVESHMHNPTDIEHDTELL